MFRIAKEMAEAKRMTKAGNKLEAYGDILEIMTADQLRFAERGSSPSASEYLIGLTDRIRDLARPHQVTIKNLGRQ